MIDVWKNKASETTILWYLWKYDFMVETDVDMNSQ